MNGRLAALVLAAALAPSFATAQLQPKSNAPVAFDSGSGGLDPTTCTFAFDGDVQLTQERSRLGARTIRGVQARQGGSCGQIERIEAVGEVFYVTPEAKVRGARAEYVRASDTITVSGEVVVDQGGNVAAAGRLVMKVSTGEMTMDSPGAGGPAGRVRGVFIPTPVEKAAPAAP